MASEPEPAQPQTSPEELTVLLRHIHDRLEGHERRPWTETSAAIVLSLAAVASAWCAFQASCWSAVQTFQLAEVGKADRAAAELHTAALQKRSADVTLLLHYIAARGAGEAKIQDFLQRRFPPELKTAFNAWMKTDPFDNPQAPRSPFLMSEYQQAEDRQAQVELEKASRGFVAAQQASRLSDRYILLSVLLASVLFFAGSVGITRVPRLRVVFVSIAVTLFMAITLKLATMPINWG